MKEKTMKAVIYAYMGSLMAVVGILNGIAWLCDPLDVATNKAINAALACWNLGSAAALSIAEWIRSINLNDMGARIVAYYEEV